MDSLALPPTQTGATAPPGQILSNEQLSLLKPLIPEESWPTFKVHFEEIHFFWAKLLLDTSVTGTNATILNALAAIRMVDSILSDESLPRWKHRFAYIRLARILESLDRIIGRERQEGHVSGRRGQGNSTIKRDIYLQAVEGESGKTLGDLHPRWGKRLDKMTGGSLFLAFAYSDKADSMIRDFSVKHDVLENISHQAIQACRQAIGDSGVFPT
ncbi:hypothetical protein MY3296_000613 [Beauveria thailandica]